jgi:predicted transposase YbfD/YdcC
MPLSLTTVIPQLLAVLAREGCIVTIDAMGAQPSIAQAIRDRGADYVLAVKDNPPLLAESSRFIKGKPPGR